MAKLTTQDCKAFIAQLYRENRCGFRDAVEGYAESFSISDWRRISKRRLTSDDDEYDDYHLFGMNYPEPRSVLDDPGEVLSEDLVPDTVWGCIIRDFNLRRECCAISIVTDPTDQIIVGWYTSLD